MSDDKKAAIAAITEAMRPQMDAAIAQYGEVLLNALEGASTAETDRCILAVEACRMNGTSALGPMHTAGWNDAIKFAADQLRAWKVRAAE